MRRDVRPSRLESRPARGEWIEILTTRPAPKDRNSLAPHGASGLKSTGGAVTPIAVGLAPHGASGLKLLIVGAFIWYLNVSPRTGRVD